jgi:hypothetical protein
MPITVDLDKNPFLRGVVEHVRKDCTVETSCWSCTRASDGFRTN